MIKFCVSIISFPVFFLALITSAHAQDEVPEVKVKEITANKWQSMPDLLNTEGPTIISFWATWCKPCIRELNTVNEVYEDWQDETNVKLIAISIDDSRSQARVPAFVNARGWEFDVYSDPNSDLSRTMGVNDIVPFTFILNKEGKIIYRHSSYNPGDEEKYYEVLLELNE